MPGSFRNNFYEIVGWFYQDTFYHPDFPMLCLFSFTFLSFALKTMEVSVTYAIWSGLGTALIAIIGFLWFREAITPIRIISLLLIIAGIIGLNVSTGGYK